MPVNRLMIITPVFPPAMGGIERLADSIAARWDGDVAVCTLREPGSAEFDAGSGHHITRAANEPRGGRRAIARLTWLAVCQARRFQPDVVLSMHVRCAGAARLARVVSGARWVQYYHAKEIPTWPRSASACRRWADDGIAVSRYTANLLSSLRVGGASDNGPVVIPPGIDLRTEVGREKAGRPTILTISRISDAYKGHDVLLEALPQIRRRVPDVHWIVVGEGARERWLADRVAELGLEDSVTLLGRVDDERRNDLLASSHVFALPSRISDDGTQGEGFGIVYAEAASFGLPVVAADQGGALDAVAHDRSGLLVDPTDPDAVADAVATILTDEQLRLRLSSGSAAWSRGFLWDRVYPRIADVLRGVPA